MKNLFTGLVLALLTLFQAEGQDLKRPIFAQKGGSFRNNLSSIPDDQTSLHQLSNSIRLVSGNTTLQVQGSFTVNVNSTGGGGGTGGGGTGGGGSLPPAPVTPGCLSISSIDAQSGAHLFRVYLTNQKVGDRDYNIRFLTNSGSLISQRDVLNINAVNVAYLLFNETNEGILANGLYRVEVRDKSDASCVGVLNYTTSQFASVPPPASTDTTIITMNGVQHKNVNATVDMGQYNLVYRTLPGSVKFKYTPRMVLKAMTTTADLQLSKFPAASLTPLDVAMYDSKVDDYTAILTKGVTHVNSRGIFNNNGGSGAISNPNRPHKDIPWTKRFHMTMSNNFDFMPEFQSGQNLTSGQIDQLKGWMTGDGVSNYFTDNQAPEWHLLDWEFQYNDNVWTQLADYYHQQYNNRYLQSWMGNSQISGNNTVYNRINTYDAWPQIGYYHLHDWNLDATHNWSDGNAEHLNNWKQLWNNDYWSVLQSLNRGERFKASYPNAWAISGYMAAYEDGAGANQKNWDYGKLHPTLAENGPLWGLLASRSVPGKKGGIIIWNAPHPNEPTTSEQYVLCGLQRLSFHNDVRSTATYQWVKPQISFDNGATWREQADITNYESLSSLAVHQTRNGQAVKEPVVRCLVTATKVTVYAQNPYPDAQATQTIKIRVPGVIEDYITVYNVTKTVGNITFNDREMTMAVANRQ